jgi:hypothetical protein
MKSYIETALDASDPFCIDEYSSFILIEIDDTTDLSSVIEKVKSRHKVCSVLMGDSGEGCCLRIYVEIRTNSLQSRECSGNFQFDFHTF